jgi:8-oxo-dGTP pyrophosphatase MutT (NUDIX family)
MFARAFCRSILGGGEYLDKSYQVAAVPTRRCARGRLELLLVTSRDTGRWVVPKGWPWKLLPDHEAAAGEAWEEAGVRGEISADPIGRYHYQKRENGSVRPLDVVVFLMEATEVRDDWPEAHQRRRAWFAPEAAAELVEEPELKDILRSLAASG